MNGFDVFLSNRLKAPQETGWDLKKEIDLEGEMQLVYEGEKALYEGAYGVIFPCRLWLGRKTVCQVKDVVVKCEKEGNENDGYEVHKWRQIPRGLDNLVKFYGGKTLELNESQKFRALLVLEKMDYNLEEWMFGKDNFAKDCTYGNLIAILQQIARGLVQLHGAGFLHMDLKLKNILVKFKESRNDLLVKIGDFGESKALKDAKNSVTNTFRGTVEYMAPELFDSLYGKDSRNRITAHVDVYSFGVVMCALFNKQKPPFTHQNHSAIGREIDDGRRESGKIFCQAPLELCDLIEQCLRFQIPNSRDSRGHGRPSFEEILSTLEEIAKRKWLSQKTPTKEDHDISAAINAYAAEVLEASSSPQEEKVDLFEAAMTGDLEKTRDLLNIGENVNIQDENLSTPLMHAAAHGNITIVKELLHRGAKIDVTNMMGASALILAAINGKIEVVEALMSKGVDENLSGSASIKSAIHHARESGHINIAELLESGAHVK